MNGQHLKALPEEEASALVAGYMVQAGLLKSADSAFAKATLKIVVKNLVGGRWPRCMHAACAADSSVPTWMRLVPLEPPLVGVHACTAAAAHTAISRYSDAQHAPSAPTACVAHQLLPPGNLNPETRSQTHSHAALPTLHTPAGACGRRRDRGAQAAGIPL